MFLFTDVHVADEGFLELVNNMLTSGMVPALYDSGEKDGIINAIRPELEAKGLSASKEMCWSYYVQVGAAVVLFGTVGRLVWEPVWTCWSHSCQYKELVELSARVVSDFDTILAI